MSYFPRRAYNVDSFGAKGDGVTDDTAAIISGLRVATGAILSFSPGRVYIWSGVQAVPNYTTLQGYGATIKAPTQTDFTFIQLYNKTGCRIEGLTFDGSWTNSASSNNAMVDLAVAANVDIKDCTFKNVSSECIRLIGGCRRVNISDNLFTGFSVAVFADDSDGAAATDVAVCRNQFYGANSNAVGTAAVKFAGLSTNTIYSHGGIVVEGNNIVKPGEMGIEMQTWFNDLVIANNTIESAVYGISVDGCARIAINGNVVRGCGYIGIETTNNASVAVNGNVVDGTSGIIGTGITSLGILVNSTSGCAVAGASVSNCASIGINVLNSSNVTVAGSNLLTSVGGSDGIYIKNSTDVNVNGNHLRSTNATITDMVGFESTDAAVLRVSMVGNTFNGPVGRYGIFLLGNNYPISDVLIADNHTAGMYAGTAMYSNQAYNGAVNSRIRLVNNIGSGDQSLNNAINIPVWSGASNLILDERYNTALIDATAAQRIVTLPTAANCNGLGFTVVKYDASANAVQLISSGGQLINTQTGQSLAVAKARMSVVSDGYNWAITQSGVS